VTFYCAHEVKDACYTLNSVMLHIEDLIKQEAKHG
jgi:hypothetical protein